MAINPVRTAGCLESFAKSLSGKDLALFNNLKNRGALYRDNLVGIKNGVAILEEPFKRNYDTTTVRHFVGFGKNGELATLKSKAIYRHVPGPQSVDRRTLSGAWSYDHRAHEFTHRSAVSVDGNLREVSIAKGPGQSDVAQQFYYLPSSQDTSRIIYNFENGTYQKLIQDPTGKLGYSVEVGNLLKNEAGEYTKQTQKLGGFSYNPNLGIFGLKNKGTQKALDYIQKQQAISTTQALQSMSTVDVGKAGNYSSINLSPHHHDGFGVMLNTYR